MTSVIIPALVLIILVIMPAAWVIAARMGGWEKLAEIHEALTPYEGKVVIASGGMGIANYGYSLLLGGDSFGLFLNVKPWLRIGHKPLFIPWEDMTFQEAQSVFYPRVLVSFKKCPGIVLRMPKIDALKVRDLPGCQKAFRGIV